MKSYHAHFPRKRMIFTEFFDSNILFIWRIFWSDYPIQSYYEYLTPIRYSSDIRISGWFQIGELSRTDGIRSTTNNNNNLMSFFNERSQSVDRDMWLMQCPICTTFRWVAIVQYIHWYMQNSKNESLMKGHFIRPFLV